MSAEWLDGDGYPTKAALRRVRKASPAEIITAITDAWNVHYGSLSEGLSVAEREVALLDPTERSIRLATGGWSGNEDVMAAYFKNSLAATMTFRLHAVGGLYILRYSVDHLA